MLKRRFFSVTGRLVSAQGSPLVGAHLSLLDQDVVRDDLIAWGATGRDGRFSASFTREAFNQDWLEDDALPHLYLEARMGGGEGASKVAFRRDFPGLVFADGEADVGTVEVPTVVDERVKDLTMGVGDWVSHRRLRVDDEVIAHVLREVVPRVQSLLGIAGLIEGVRVRTSRNLMDTFAATADRVIGAEGQVPSWLGQPPSSTTSSQRQAFSFYEPHDRVLWLNEESMAQGGLDVMKATVARELVRVGQFQKHPELRERFEQSVRTLGDLARYMRRTDPNEVMPDELCERVLAQYSFSLVTDGHVQHVDEGWIRPWYPLAEFIDSIPSVFDVGRLLVRQAPGIGAALARARPPSAAVHTSPLQRGAAGLVLRRLDAAGEEQGRGKTLYDDKQLTHGKAGAPTPVPFDPAMIDETRAHLRRAFELMQNLPEAAAPKSDKSTNSVP